MVGGKSFRAKEPAVLGVGDKYMNRGALPSSRQVSYPETTKTKGGDLEGFPEQVTLALSPEDEQGWGKQEH